MEHDNFPADQVHSDRFLDMASRTNRFGSLKSPDGYGKRVSDCGDTIELFLSVRGGQIQMVCFQIQGCINTNACANTLSYLAEGRSIADSWQISPQDVITYLQTLPPGHDHCAELVVGAFYHALNDYTARSREAWKNAYKKW